MDNFKLIERSEDGRVHLYNIEEDISEQIDLSELYPQKVQDMRNQLHDWYKQVGAKFLRKAEDGPDPWRPD